MRLRHLLVVLVAVSLGLLVVPAASAATRTWWAQGWWAGDPVYRARTLQVSGDGTYFMRHMTWATWGSDRARGHGRAAVNDCNPSCAEGTFHTYPVRVRLLDPKLRCGRRFFDKIVIVYPTTHPRGIPSKDVWSYPIAC